MCTGGPRLRSFHRSAGPNRALGYDERQLSLIIGCGQEHALALDPSQRDWSKIGDYDDLLADELVRCADLRASRAKSLGRNRACGKA